VSPGQLCVQASSTTPISLLHAQRVKNAVRILTMTTRWLLGRHASCLVSGIDNDERRRRDWEALLHCFRCSPSIWSFCCYEQKHCNNRLYISCLFVCWPDYLSFSLLSCLSPLRNGPQSSLCTPSSYSVLLTPTTASTLLLSQLEIFKTQHEPTRYDIQGRNEM
jgi:hypothetical protein